MEFIIINLATAEVNIAPTKESAERFCKENNLILYSKADEENPDFDMGTDERVIILPCEEVEEEQKAELIIYSNSDKHSIFSDIAEYREDLMNTDLIESPEVPVKYIYEFNIEE